MMTGKKSNKLIMIENGQLSEYLLDNKIIWEVGRLSKENNPDVKMHIPTVSRKHGRFQNMDGVWFYVDYKGKNGTICNGEPIGTGLRGRAKPVLLRDGDVLIFGGGTEAVINAKTVWVYYTDIEYEGNWKAIDSKGYKDIHFCSGGNEIVMKDPNKGTVIRKEEGMAIFMGDITYTIGNMDVYSE